MRRPAARDETLATEPASGRASSLASRLREFLTSGGTGATAQRAAVTALVIRLASAAFAYLAQVVLARVMGQHEYGVFAYTWVWFLVFSAIATFGFGDSPLRFIAQLRERGETDHLRGFLRFAALAILASSVAVGGLLIAVLPFMGGLIDSVYLMPMALMAVSIPFACLQSLLEGIGRSFNWPVPALVPVYILRHGLLLVVMLVAVHFGLAPTALSAFLCLIVTMTIGTAGQALVIVPRLRHVVTPGPRAYRRTEWLCGSIPFAVIYAAQHLASFADVLVLSFFVDPGTIAVYFAATRIIQVVNLVPYAATVGTAHLFSASHTRGDYAGVQRLTRYVVTANVVIASAATLLIVAGGDWLLGMFGTGFEAGHTPLVILAVGVLARVAAGPAEDVLNMTGHGALSASTYVVIVAVNAALAAILIVPFGVNGAATASAVALVVRAVWLSYSAHRRLGIDTSLLAAIGHRLRRSPAEAPAE
jgi:O-antigen/teichoic acid export membrane protein